MQGKQLGGKMLTEAELQKKWENLTFTDDFIFSRVMHDEHICRQVVELILGVRIGEKFSPRVLRGGSGFAEAQPRLAKIAALLAIFRLSAVAPYSQTLPAFCWNYY